MTGATWDDTTVNDDETPDDESVADLSPQGQAAAREIVKGFTGNVDTGALLGLNNLIDQLGRLPDSPAINTAATHIFDGLSGPPILPKMDYDTPLIDDTPRRTAVSIERTADTTAELLAVIKGIHERSTRVERFSKWSTILSIAVGIGSLVVAIVTVLNSPH